MLRTVDLIDGGYVVPNDADSSSVWERVAVSRDMPDGAQPLSDEKLSVIREWIDAGAPSFDSQVDVRPQVTLSDNLTAIRDDLRKHSESQRKYLRYFTLTHMHNNSRVSSDDLNVVRAGLSKLVNSLSWQIRRHIPTPIDQQKTIMRIDVREVGWDEDEKWNLLLEKYPYGLLFDVSDDEVIRARSSEVHDLSGQRLPAIRADWFIRYASSPPLYHDLLGLPDGAFADRKLEEMLGVDVERDVRESSLHRAAFVQSNVSLHNRLVDRHVGRRTRTGIGTAYYWKSYDFASSAGRQDLTRHPLGPAFSVHDTAAFQHDGGEVVFSLPNGMQGYLIVDAKGNRIDEAPISVVVDSERKPLNSPVVVNGISCMACHDRGIRKFRDTVRRSHAVFGEARRSVERLYSPRTTMAKLIASDESHFLKSLADVMSPFADVLTTEPISAVTQFYVDGLNLMDVAAELGVANPDELLVLFRSTSFREYGMAPLVNGGTIKRETWETLDPPAYSLFHTIAEELQIGEPYRRF